MPSTTSGKLDTDLGGHAYDDTKSNIALNDLAIAEAQAKLKKDGYCVIPNLIDAEKTKEVLDRLWATAEETKKRGMDLHMPRLDPNASNVRVFYLLELDKIFCELIDNPTSVKMVQGVVGQNYLISNFTANIARPGSKSMALHSDQSLVVPDPWKSAWAVNVIWCLTDVYFENGATLYIPGSHKWENRSDVPPNANKMLIPFEAKAGSIIVMDGRTWHTSGANITEDKDRALLFGYYTVPFLRQQVNWTAAMSKETLDSLTPIMRERLGVDVTANTGNVSRLRYLSEQYKDDDKVAEEVPAY